MLEPEATSPRSVIPAGGAMADELLIEKPPTTIAPLKTLVADGAVMLVELAVPAVKVSTGLVVFTPL